MPFISSSELCSRIQALHRKILHLNNPFQWRNIDRDKEVKRDRAIEIKTERESKESERERESKESERERERVSHEI